MIVAPRRWCRRFSSTRILVRNLASRLESGSSSRNTLPCCTSARPIATRWRSIVRAKPPPYDVLGGPRMTNFSRRSILIGLPILVTAVAAAAEPRLALKGYDPVSYFTEGHPEQGSAEYQAAFDD